MTRRVIKKHSDRRGSPSLELLTGTLKKSPWAQIGRCTSRLPQEDARTAIQRDI